MRIGTEDRKKLGILAVVGGLGLGAAWYIYSSLMVSDAPQPAAPAVVSTAKPAAPAKAAKTTGGVAVNVGTTSAQLDPTLKMGPMLVTESLVYSGTGRNIFSSASMPVIPKPIAPVRPKAPLTPVATAPFGPPPPPPIDLKFFGVETTANGKRRALLLKGDDVFLAGDGDIVQRRYRVLTVMANSVVVEDLANSNQQTLPLIAR
ncbi:hypothetical protein [Edaphobacter bradus]|uniref:hypothetical protein n=1 Tax=Edaphobacter bradus TaxID=2259016 RepID=UPI0021DF62DB|nr:hypothetical protein [Edaphobacter bradus]